VSLPGYNLLYPSLFHSSEEIINLSTDIPQLSQNFASENSDACVLSFFVS